MKVSVCMIVYNHENYIREAILGVLNQEVNFDIELVISNDNSTDHTNNIIKDLIASHDTSKLINYKNNEQNKGMMLNFIDTLKTCKGEFIAFCEGDDYWTDKFKLQKQIDFLDQNKDYNICFHNVKIYNQELNQLEKDTITRQVEETTTINDLAIGNYLHTPSVVIRNNFKIPNWFYKSPLGDWVLYIIAIQDKKIKKLDDIMAVYRVHSTSVWSRKSNDNKLKATIKGYNLLIKSNVIDKSIKKKLAEAVKTMKKSIVEKDSFIDKLKVLFK